MKLRMIGFFIIIMIGLSLLPACGSNSIPTDANTSSIALTKSTDKNTSQSEVSQDSTAQTNTQVEKVQPKLVEYNGTLYHIFYHCLIAFPDVAYNGRAKGALDTDCVTVTEFKRCLDELYKNNYVLVDINSTFETVNENGKSIVKEKKLMLPEGKKPLIMSIDDMVYDPKKLDWGMVDKIIMDEKGNFETYTKLDSGEVVISDDNEVIPILDKFVKLHPDFSFDGAKATLALTGWVGILGYRTNLTSPNRQSEIEAVKPIIARLKATGWTFACHGFGHRHSRKITYGLFAEDTKKWMSDVEPLVGPTSIYVYPYGEALYTTDPKYTILLNDGFKVFCSVYDKPYLKNFPTSIYMTRQGIDGFH